MNIILSAAIIILSVYFKLKYRPSGRKANKMFAVAIASAVVIALSLGSLRTVGSAVFWLIDIALCGVIVLSYRMEIARQLKARASRKAAAQAAIAEASRMIYMPKRRLSSVAAFSECDFSAEQQNAAA